MASPLTCRTQDLIDSAQDLTRRFGFNLASQLASRQSSNSALAACTVVLRSDTYTANGLNQYSSVTGTTYNHDANDNLQSNGAHINAATKLDLGAWLHLPTNSCATFPSEENAVSQKFPQRNQLKHTRKKYRVRRWREYEASLCKRGDLTIWFSEDALRDWHAVGGTKPGGQYRYSEMAIETALTVRAVYGLALRQTEGFLKSIARLLQLDIDIPDHTTLSRRSATLKAHDPNPDSAAGPVHIRPWCMAPPAD